MPVQTTFPGVYIEELPSGVRTITGVGTSTTAFVGYAARGPDHKAVRLFGIADYERSFGGLTSDSLMGYAVSHFFANGGTEAYVVRVPKHDSVEAGITLQDAAAKEALRVTAYSPGAWANDVLVDVDHSVPAGDAKAFNLQITDVVAGAEERFDNVTLDLTKPNNVVAVVNDEATGSKLVTVAVPDDTADRPEPSGTISGAIVLGDLKNDQDYGLHVILDVPATDVTVVIFAEGETIPGSLTGLASQIERKINLELATAVPGARVRCAPMGASLRFVPDFEPELLPDALDSMITFGASAPSALAMLKLGAAATANVGHYRLGKGRQVGSQVDPVLGEDGVELPHTSDVIGSPAAFTGMHALEKVDLFNILCIPDAVRSAPGDPNTIDPNMSPNDVYAAAAAYCEKRRAFLLVDPPPETGSLEAALDWISSGLTVKTANAAAYFPHIRAGDPLDGFKPRVFPPSGAVAGLMARTDAERGVWKSPAGTDAQVRGVSQLIYKLSDPENGVLNPLGLNCLRSLPVHGTVAWGARTLLGADVAASQWKYLSVRRLALMIEESLYRGTKWAVFEPNDERLWSQLRLNIGTFMDGLFRQGAFQGTKPAEAFLVKCDSQTTTQADIDRGVVNVLVGFAPLKPAEFVIIRIQQLAGNQPA